MNKTLEIYHALLQDLQKNKYDPSSNIHRKYTCTNQIGIVYSVSIGARMRALSIPADKTSQNMNFPVWKGVRIELVTMPDYSPNNQLYIQLQQMPGTEPYIFEIVADDLRRGIDTMPSGQGSTKRTTEILKKWKEFFTAGKLPILSGAATQGLY